ncbi:N-acetylglutamate synthase [Longilinea arvoryzae]|uniref:N-acetylglutamate synthase n=1 Tax=Longilinea arvoryzae TaxID=360412 RepID=A0A0S7BH57_9CHLR|nr:GNAT family N-acetyltransferase [Longilinea arvoryzae]GAP14480.1 N-acetylglutamate synthase [Longilinea arvoryzae]
MNAPCDSIRLAAAADEDSILGLAGRIENFQTEDVECIRQLWRDYLTGGEDPDRYHFLVFEEGGVIRAFACYGHRPLTRGAYDFYWLATDPETRGRGIGRRLMARVEAEIRGLGGYLVLIETSDSSAFENTRRFHESNGYIRIGEVADFYAPGDGLVMYQKKV